ncbi:DNA helicase [Tanacetum coccineum]
MAITNLQSVHMVIPNMCTLKVISSSQILFFFCQQFLPELQIKMKVLNAWFIMSTTFATNKALTTNAHKRKTAHPLLIARAEKPSSSRNITRRFTLTSSNAHYANANRNNTCVNNQNLRSKSSCDKDDAPSYIDLGNFDQVCRHCGCLFWYNERLKGTHYTRQAEYHLCCGGGQIYMPPMPNPPAFIQQILKNTHFMEHIRACNQMFAMTSFGAKINDSVNKGRGPYVFKIFGQIYNWIGSLCPEEGFYRELTLKPQGGRGRGKKVTMNAYYKYHLHPQVKEFSLIFRGERLFQQGDREGVTAGSKIMLLNTFTGGPRVFEQKGKDFIKFLREVRTFGYVCAVLYTIEFQKRGLPHCHTLLWVDSKGELQDAQHIAKFISAEIHDPMEDPRGYKLVTDLMMHGPCGNANLGAPVRMVPEFKTIETKTDKNKQVTWKDNLYSSKFRRPILPLDVIMPSKRIKLWIKHWQAMRDDIPAKISKTRGIPNYHVNTAELQGYILYELEEMLNGFGKFITDFGMQLPSNHLLKDLENKLLMEEKNYNRDLLKEDVAQSVPKLNHDQKKYMISS